MFGLANKVAGLNLGNIYYHQSASELHLNCVMTFSYLKDLDDVGLFDISGVYGRKGSEQVKLGVAITAVITYKLYFW